MRFFLFFITIISSLSAKPVIDLYDWRSTMTPHRPAHLPIYFERPDFILMGEGKNSDVIILMPWLMKDAKKLRAQGYKKIVLILSEARTGSPSWGYSYAEKHRDHFDLILTFDPYLLKKYPEKCKFLFPMGAGTLFNEGLHKKTKLCSCMASRANSLEGHFLRRTVVDKYKDYFEDYKHYSTPYAYWKDPWLCDFAFSVIIENARQPNYFTEKITEAFRAGTIPIYWGCPNIGDFFDMDGIILFSSLEELEEILKNLSFEEYEKRLNAVKTNFERAAAYPTYKLTSSCSAYQDCYNNLGHEIEECHDRPDALDKIWPYVKDYFSEIPKNKNKKKKKR